MPEREDMSREFQNESCDGCDGPLGANGKEELGNENGRTR